jgi:hypothetical protein
LATADVDDDWGRNQKGQTSMVPLQGGTLGGDNAVTRHSFRDLATADYDDGWQRGSKGEQITEEFSPDLAQTVNPADHTFRDLDYVDKDFDWMRGQKGERTTEEFGPDLAQTVNPANHTFRDLDYVDKDFDWMRGQKGERTTEEFGPDLAQTVNPADHTFRDLDRIETEMDWMANQKGERATEEFGPDLAQTVNPANHTFRDVDRIENEMDWMTNQKGEEATFQFGPDLAQTVNPANHEFRDLDRIEGDMDWMGNQKGEEATLQFGPDLAQTVNPAHHDFRDLDRIESDEDWMANQKGERVTEEFGFDLAQTVNPAEHNFRDLDRIESDMDWMGNQKGEDITNKFGYDLAQTVNPADHDFRDLDNVDRDMDWHRGAKGERVTEEFGLDLAQTVNPAHHTFRDVDKIENDMDWHRGGKEDNVWHDFGPDLAQTVNPADHAFRDLVKIDNDMDWHRGAKDDKTTTEIGLDLSRTVNAADHSFRDLQGVEYDADWHRGGKADDVLKQFAPDLSQTVNPADHAFRELTNIDNAFDWNRNQKGEKYTEDIVPDLSGAESVYDHIFRDNERVDRGMDWHGPSKSKHDQSFQEPFYLADGRDEEDAFVSRDAGVANHDFRPLLRVDHAYDWHQSPKRRNHTDDFNTVPGEDWDGTKGMVRQGMTGNRGDFGGGNEILDTSYEPEPYTELQAALENHKFRDMPKIARKYDWHRGKQNQTEQVWDRLGPNSEAHTEKPLMEQVSEFPRAALRPSDEKLKGWNMSTHVKPRATEADSETKKKYANPKSFLNSDAPLAEAVENYNKRGLRDAGPTGKSTSNKPAAGGWNVSTRVQKPVLTSGFEGEVYTEPISPTRTPARVAGWKENRGADGDGADTEDFKPKKLKPFSHTQPGKLLYSSAEPDTQPLEILPAHYVKSLRDEKTATVSSPGRSKKLKPFAHGGAGPLLQVTHVPDSEVIRSKYGSKAWRGEEPWQPGVHGRVNWQASLRGDAAKLNFDDSSVERESGRPVDNQPLPQPRGRDTRSVTELEVGEEYEFDQDQKVVLTSDDQDSKARRPSLPSNRDRMPPPGTAVAGPPRRVTAAPERDEGSGEGVNSAFRKHQFRTLPGRDVGRGWVSTPSKKKMLLDAESQRKLPTGTANQRLEKFRNAAYGDAAKRNNDRLDGKAAPMIVQVKDPHAVRLAERLDEARAAAAGDRPQPVTGSTLRKATDDLLAAGGGGGGEQDAK